VIGHPQGSIDISIYIYIYISICQKALEGGSHGQRGAHPNLFILFCTFFNIFNLKNNELINYMDTRQTVIDVDMTFNQILDEILTK
jgi:hypothetical protein